MAKVELKVYRDGNFLGMGVTAVNNISPALFTADASGRGLVSGLLYVFDKTTGALLRIVALTQNPGNDWNTATEDAYLVVFGTGIRRASGFSAQVGGIGHTVQFAGPAPGYLGLDQVNIGPLSPSLRGTGEKEIRFFAGGLEANRTKVWFRLQ
jgi:uncharacterized protein (TIGR03437 family)